MSVEWIDKVWKDQSITNGTSLLILLALADYSNDEGMSYPSIPKLAKKARISERQVQRELRVLEADGLVTIDRTDGGRNSRHRFWLTVGNGDIQDASGDNGDIHDTNGDICDMETVTSMSPAINRHANRQSEPSASKRVAVTKTLELQELEAHWKAEGLGPVSMNASGQLRGLLAAHGLELCKEGVTKAAEQRVRSPVAWLNTVLPAWKRERGGGTGEKERKHKFVFIGMDGKEIT